MKKFNFKICGNNYGVHIQSIEDGMAQIEVNGTKYEVEIEQEIKVEKTPRLVRKVVPAETKKIEKKPEGAATAVKSPLPGQIFKVLVKVGDAVKSGDTLLIVEAMKMENNILAEKDGTIDKILVNEGDAVLEGDTLLETV